MLSCKTKGTSLSGRVQKSIAGGTRLFEKIKISLPTSISFCRNMPFCPTSCRVKSLRRLGPVFQNLCPILKVLNVFGTIYKFQRYFSHFDKISLSIYTFFKYFCSIFSNFYLRKDSSCLVASYGNLHCVKLTIRETDLR